MTRRGPAISPDCGACPLAIDGKPHKPVPGIGPDHRPDMIIVGMEPGNSENKVGLPFVGASGQLLNRVLRLTEVDRERIWITNSSNCWRPETGDGDREQARVCCKPRLERELAQFDPSIPIMALGASAAKSLLESTLPKDMLTMNQLIGTSQEITLNGDASPRTVITAIHPAAILRGGDDGGTDMLYLRMLYDVRKAKKLGAGDDSIRFSEDIAVAVDPDEAHKLVSDIIEEIQATPDAPFGLDWETRPAKNAPAGILRFASGKVDDVDPLLSGIEPKKKKKGKFIPAFWTEITALGLSTAKRAIAIAWWNLRDKTKALIRALFASAIPKIIQNRVFDTCVGKRHGFPISEPIDDLMLAHHCAFPGMPHVLQAIASQFWLISAWKSEFRNSQGTPMQLLSYCAKDSLVLPRTLPRVKTCITETQTEAAYAMDLKMAALAERMHMVGMPVSRAVNSELAERLAGDIKEATEAFLSHFADPVFKEKFADRVCREQAKTKRKGDKDDYEERVASRRAELDAFGWNHTCKITGKEKKYRIKLGEVCKDCGAIMSFGSNAHVVAFLRAHGVNLWLTTAKGKLSTKQTILDQLVHVDGVRPLLKRREAHKLKSTFVDPIPGLLDDNDRLHVIWSVNKITGRFGSEALNVQNWPKSNPKGQPNLRSQIVAPPGRIFIGFDAAQLEARVHALLSGDAFLVKIFNDAASCAECRGRPPGKFCKLHDIHVVFCREVWKDYDSFSPEQQEKLRDEIKQPEYGCMYGASVDTMHQSILRFHPKAQKSATEYMASIIKQKLTGVNAWHDELIREVMRTGEIRSLLTKRRRVFPMGTASPNEIWNFPVQCLKFDQHVLTDKGWVEVQTLDPKVHAVVQTNGSTNSYKVHFSGTKPIVTIETQGRRVEASNEHRFLVYAGDDGVEWRTVAELEVGDWLVIRDAQAEEDSSTAAPVDEVQAEVIGALFGNGHYAGRGAVISTGEKAYANHIGEQMCRALKVNVTVSRGRDGTWRAAAHAKQVQEALLSWGFLPRSKRAKRLPAWIETAPRNIQLAVLRGLFDTDGGFGGRWISYATCIQSQARVIQRLLLRIGIDCRFGRVWSHTPAGDRRRYYRVRLMPWAVPTFATKIGFRHGQRAAWLETREMADARQPMPPALTAWLGRELFERVSAERKSWTTLDHGRLSRLRAGSASLEQILRVIDKAAESGFYVDDLRITATRWRFERVVKTRKQRKSAPTFDLSINGNHDYVVEGLVTHNSTGADIVGEMMLRILPALPTSAAMTNQSHDSGLIEVDEEAEADLAEAAVKANGPAEYTHNGITIQFPVTVKRAKSWAQAS